MIRPTVARVDLAAIENNLREIQRFLFRSGNPDSRSPIPDPRSPKIIAVVKANAYGHGASEVALALERAGAAMLACADIEEGIVLRRAGVRIPVVVFGALGISDLDGVFPGRRCRAPGSNRGQTGVRPGSDRGQSGVRPGSGLAEIALSPENRYRHEPSRFPPRQPGADPPRDRKK
jgi:hypothetical protein